MDGAEEDDARRARFEALVAVVVEPVRRFLARRADPDTADDVLADTLLVLWRRLDDVPAGDEALPWTYAVARNALANAERGARRQRRLAHRITVVDPPDEVAPAEAEPDDRVAAALAQDAARRGGAAAAVGLGAAGPRADRDGARPDPQRGEHPAAPGAREVQGDLRGDPR